MRFYPILILSLITVGCSTDQMKTEQHTFFSELNGVTAIEGSCNIYNYKDTLYFFNAASDCLYKIPYGFSYSKGGDLDIDGLHLWNADSTITIDIFCLDYGYPKHLSDGSCTVTHEDILVQRACDNADIRMYYETSENGYLKIGFTEENKPMLEKCEAIFDDDEDMINSHLHIVRMVYSDSNAKQAANISDLFILSWPNNFYK